MEKFFKFFYLKIFSYNNRAYAIQYKEPQKTIKTVLKLNRGVLSDDNYIKCIIALKSWERWTEAIFWLCKYFMLNFFAEIKIIKKQIQTAIYNQSK